MALTILDHWMGSDRSTHTARHDPASNWEVTWLPGQHLTRNSAITAMVLADATARGDLHPGHPLWLHVEGWAAEPGLDVSEALDRSASPLGQKSPERTAPQTDPEAAG